MERIAESPASAVFALPELYEECYQRYRRAVYHRNYRRLSRYRVTAPVQVAEDLCQETFHSLYRWMCNFWKANQTRPSDDILERALKTIEINEYRTHMKRARYHIYDGAVVTLEGEFDHPEDLVPSGELNPEEELLRKEYETRLQRCLNRLKSTERMALIYKLIGYSDKETAELIGQTQKKVMFSIIPLGRRKLRKWMASYMK